MESMAVILALNVIQDFFRTATNLFGGQCILLDASGKFKMNRQDAEGSDKVPEEN